ncbi:class I SAM-dependent methyltransferase [Chondromyces apiculatus]|uniref:O-methyltransferase domain protein n=1 Tax=Chondromyces apiculatus DSM 436 TaxID=1192034 RepID=A0A017T778_9BACT|nr:class I SAM-dependent methyltransferase [Chondromyces apiculatus]EYF05098.1 O-methyltransferase domain protein [Chondromyces apiculatus DSM 436]
MTRRKVHFTETKATLLLTLYGKALESKLPDSALKDTYAAAAVAQIDYDFEKLKLKRDAMIGLAMRASMIDGWTRAFLASQPEATVVHLGCGLDSRVFRVDPPPTARWFDVDFPDVVALRREVYPARDHYELVGTSVTELGWIEALPSDKPALIVGEGLLPYLEPDKGIALLRKLVAHFPSGEMAFDVYSNLGVKTLTYQPSIRATGARLGWGIDDVNELVRAVPGLRLLDEVEAYDPEQVARMGRVKSAIVRLMLKVPALRKMGRLVRFQF